MAPGRSISKIWSSLVSDRVSMPFFRYGPNLPFCAVISEADSGSIPTMRGNASSRSAVSRSIEARSMLLNSDAVRGLSAGAIFFAAGFRLGFTGVGSMISPVAASTTGSATMTGAVSAAAAAADAVATAGSMTGAGASSVTYGPNRPSLATISLPVSGFTPITRSTETGASMSSRALAAVSSSGARSGGMFTRRGGASGAAPGTATSRYGPYLPMRSVISSSMTTELMVRASISPRLSMTCRRPRCLSLPK